MGRDEHHFGLVHDLKIIARMAERRRVLRWMAGASLVPLVGCGGNDAMTIGSAGASGAGGSSGAGSETDAGPTTCSKIPEETGGPYPGDGSNGANALALSGIVRSDIRSSFAGATGTAEGIPLTVKLTLMSAAGGCAKLSGYAVYIWHCDRAGQYSMYTIVDQNYLRGVQETDADGSVTFTTIFPACYAGRWPHIHFEIFPSVAEATSSASRLATSQLALPQDVCNDVFATDGYAQSVTNLAQVSLATDMVFSDGYAEQVPLVTGSVSAGYLATLNVAVAV
jgi:protocatechuate 3,4-dioxygenase beta subunit